MESLDPTSLSITPFMKLATLLPLAINLLVGKSDKILFSPEYSDISK